VAVEPDAPPFEGALLRSGQRLGQQTVWQSSRCHDRHTGGMEHTSALEIVTIVVAGYAALVGTLALAVQVATWFRTWATRVEVTLSPMQIIDATGTDEAIVLFRMINHSEHPVKITSLGFAPQKRGGMGAVIARPYPLGQPLPIPIAARGPGSGLDPPGQKAELP
jgi:hypothetical protein